MEDSILNFEEKMWRLLELSRERMPELNESYYGGVSKTVYAEGALDIKTKRLMSLAVAVQAGCTNCMISQTSRAIELGATVEEVIESCAVAISMGGTLAWSKAMTVFEYLRARELI